MALCSRNCKVCRYYKVICSGCSSCEAPLGCGSNCDNCIYTCIKRPGAAYYFEKIGGADIDLLPNGRYEIPPYVPTLPSRMNIEYDASQVPVVSIHGGKFFRASGEDILPAYLKRDPWESFGLNKETKIILHFYIPDRTLEGFWLKRHEIYPKLKQMGFSFIISPNFSVYTDSPRIEHLLNIRRTVTMYNELLEQGINTVPDISWYEKKDLDRWASAITKAGVKTVSFSLQNVGTEHTTNAWKGYLMGLRYFLERIPEDVGLIIVGINALRRFREILKVTGKRALSIINTHAFMRSERGFYWNGNRAPAHLKLDDIFIENVVDLNRIYGSYLSENRRE